MTLLNKLKKYIKDIEDFNFVTPNDNTVKDEIIQILHDHYNGNLLTSFLVIEQLNKEKIKKENMLLYRGLEDGMHNLTSVCKHLLEDGNSRSAKTISKMYFTEDNLAYLINIAKAYFQDGTSKGASNSGIWFFSTFKDLLVKHKNKYLKGGDSHDWAVRCEHIDYIKLVLSKTLEGE